jgi:hypothetical protein
MHTGTSAEATPIVCACKVSLLNPTETEFTAKSQASAFVESSMTYLVGLVHDCAVIRVLGQVKMQRSCPPLKSSSCPGVELHAV